VPFYQRLGDVPRKRHVQFRENGTLLTEEVMGLEGFTGNESILYHLHSPCRVMELAGFEPIEREEWVPEQHAHRHFKTFDTEPEGDEITGRRLLMWNGDVEISLCRPSGTMDYFFRNGEGDEVIFVHEGSGTLETTFGTLAYSEGDYVVVPRGTTYRFKPARRPPEADSVSGPGGGGGPPPPPHPPPAADASSLTAQRYLVFETPGLIEIPRRYRNQYGQLVEGAPYYHRDIHPPAELQTVRERGEFPVKVRVRGGYQTYVVDYHPFDVVGWDGYLYPWTFSIHDFEPITGRIHQPPPSHQTFQGQNFVICSFCPRKLDFDPLAVPIPYHHSNLQSEEMIYYVSGSFGSRKGVEVGSITLHPSGLPHGPQPGLAERSIGMHETHELAVMCDTFHPLKLTPFARDLDDGRYAYSWYENAEDGTAGAGADGDASGAGLTSHL
jgi:homogentisate 1,2-dioxygenase